MYSHKVFRIFNVAILLAFFVKPGGMCITCITHDFLMQICQFYPLQNVVIYVSHKISPSSLCTRETIPYSHLPLPLVKGASEYLGVECSGIVMAVEERVSHWKVGDQVQYFGVLLFFFSLALEVHPGNGRSIDTV